jgi:hypothetical protein
MYHGGDIDLIHNTVSVNCEKTSMGIKSDYFVNFNQYENGAISTVQKLIVPRMMNNIIIGKKCAFGLFNPAGTGAVDLSVVAGLDNLYYNLINTDGTCNFINYYKKVKLVGPPTDIFVDLSKNNYYLKEGDTVSDLSTGEKSSPIDTGTIEVGKYLENGKPFGAELHDIVGWLRPSGNGYDFGAFEHHMLLTPVDGSSATDLGSAIDNGVTDKVDFGTFVIPPTSPVEPLMPAPTSPSAPPPSPPPAEERITTPEPTSRSDVTQPSAAAATASQPAAAAGARGSQPAAERGTSSGASGTSTTGTKRGGTGR